MPKAANKPTAPSPTDSELSFEGALSQLESVLERMESGDLPLEKLLNEYEDGTRLAKVCQSKLSEAELKIGKLTKNASGELSVAPTDLSEQELQE